MTPSTSGATIAIQRSAERAFFDHGWLKTYHSFSFADYYDPANLQWGALRVFNDDTVAAGQGFGTHPHRDMEIVTYVLEGDLEHQDSMGHAGVVPPGGVQYMSAGSGIRHSEFNHSQSAPVHFVQMWVQPKTLGEPPAYGQHTWEAEERDGRWLVVASGLAEVAAPIALRQDAVLRVARLRPSTPLAHAAAANRFGFLFVASGEATVAGTRLAAGDALRFTGPADLEITGDAELVLWDVPPAT